MGLEEYNAKRKFNTTSEPQGAHDGEDKKRFVVQRHDARKLHYDLRLEMDGVLKSWAVPKGPSMNPNDKRLAINTEDHPVKYLDFEGNIPKGNYGAGDMQIWDHGTYAILSVEDDTAQGLKQMANGDLKIRFSGEKLKGDFALVKMKSANEKKQWLLIKKQDRFATELDYDPEVFINAPKSSKPGKLKKLDVAKVVKPMLATQTEHIFNDPEWVYEIKWDGYRILAHIGNGNVELFSRNGNAYGGQFPQIKNALGAVVQDVILDGEIVVVDEAGVPHFQALQNYDAQTTPGELRYYVFDMLFLNGHEMLDLPLLDRKSLIPEVIDGLEHVFYCDHVEGMGKTFYERAIAAELEGVIAKKKDSTYSPGHRSENWLKVKAVQSEEALICGYTDSVKGGSLFGSLILGRFKDGKLVYIGNCGSGYDSEEQQRLLAIFESLNAKKSPFAEKTNLRGRKPHWLQPRLICEVKFSEWTDNDIMRHPIYKGLRADKNPQEIISQEKVSSRSKNLKNNKRNSNNNNKSNSLELDGVHVPLSNLEKIYWPDSGLRKYDLIDYYLNIAETILPYQKDRPQNLHRHPDGITTEGFYQKDHENQLKWVKTVNLHSKSTKKNIEYLLCQDGATLLYLANLGCIELNPWSSRIDTLDHPDYTVIDLDPSPKNTFEEVIEVAQGIKQILDTAQIKGYCKTSGSRGLHVYIPLAAKYSYGEARDFTKLLCYFVQEKIPKLTTMQRKIKDRNGKIYLDYLQNRRAQTLASAYCVRPRPQAPVSAPLRWEEVKIGLQITDFTLSTMPKRIKEFGDLFKPVLEKGIDMPAALDALENME